MTEKCSVNVMKQSIICVGILSKGLSSSQFVENIGDLRYFDSVVGWKS